MKLLPILVFVALSVAVVACGTASQTPTAETSATTDAASAEVGASSATPQPPATATSQPTATSTPEAEVVSLEGAFSYRRMADYLDAITPMVAQFYETSYTDIPDPSLVYIESGQAARSRCGTLYSDAFAYCAASQTIYVGQDLLWAFYSQAGDAAPAIALAHEWGHHVQYYRGVPYGRTSSVSVAFENQADCLSGAWAQYADEQGWLETEDDLDDVSRLMQLIGSAETARRDHGTTEERSEAFQIAYTGGAVACNVYFPDDPVAWGSAQIAPLTRL